MSGWNFWFNGQKREGRIHSRADEALSGQERLHPHSDY